MYAKRLSFDANSGATPRFLYLKSQVVLLQTAHSWANAGVLLGGRMHRERGSYRDEVSERKVKFNELVNHVQYDVVVT